MEISTSCFIGILLIVIGLTMKLYPPEHINNTLGYKTPFSMKSKDTWLEGNRFCGVMFLASGIILIPFSLLINYLYKNNPSLSMKISALGLLIILLMSILYTEIHLRMLFDKNGIKKRQTSK